jgi:hypothetical protein
MADADQPRDRGGNLFNLLFEIAVVDHERLHDADGIDATTFTASLIPPPQGISGETIVDVLE